MYNKTKKILIVDDERDMREMLNELFELEGYETYTAADGREGLRIYKEIEPDLVITDIRMPVMDGIDLVKRLRSINKNVKIVYITGWESAQSKHKREVIKDTDYKYLKKPFDLDEIIFIVKNYIEK